jgi:hypothetical protein
VLEWLTTIIKITLMVVVPPQHSGRVVEHLTFNLKGKGSIPATENGLKVSNGGFYLKILLTVVFQLTQISSGPNIIKLFCP